MPAVAAGFGDKSGRLQVASSVAAEVEFVPLAVVKAVNHRIEHLVVPAQLKKPTPRFIVIMKPRQTMKRARRTIDESHAPIRETTFRHHPPQKDCNVGVTRIFLDAILEDEFHFCSGAFHQLKKR